MFNRIVKQFRFFGKYGNCHHGLDHRCIPVPVRLRKVKTDVGIKGLEQHPLKGLDALLIPAGIAVRNSSAALQKVWPIRPISSLASL
jgi:hypothetical protein